MQGARLLRRGGAARVLLAMLAEAGEPPAGLLPDPEDPKKLRCELCELSVRPGWEGRHLDSMKHRKLMAAAARKFAAMNGL